MRAIQADTQRAADLLERLLTDPAFRGAFRRSPAEAAAAAGLPDVADELRHPSRALQTLEIRESKSSLAGVFMAAASEGIGVAQFVGFLHSRGSLDGGAALALNGALERASVQNAVAAEPVAADPLDAVGAGAAAPTAVPVEPTFAEAVMPPEASTAAGAPAPPVAAAEQPPAAAAMFAAPASDAPATGGPASDAPPATFDDPGSGQPMPAAEPVPATPPPVPEPSPAAAPAPVAAAVEAIDVPTGAGRPVAPLDPADMTGSNAGGKLHGSEFNIADAEGAPGPNGRIHAGYDLFGKADAPIRAPADGEVIEIKDTGRTSGQVFGAAVKVRMADGRVWVFRHVVPKIAVGDRVHAGDVFAAISPWTDGPTHTHIELWKTFEGGYDASNMEDPLDELKRAYEGGGAPAPAATPSGDAVVAAVGEQPPAGGDLEAVVAHDARPVTAVTVARNDRIEWDGSSRDRLKTTVDPRVLVVLDALAKVHSIRVGAVTHDGFELVGVDGKPVSADNAACRDLVEALAALDGSLRPSSVGSPWRVASAGFYTDAAHAGNLHVRLPAAGFLSAPGGAQSVQFLRAVQPGTPSAAAGAADAPTPKAPAGGGTPGVAAEAFVAPGVNGYPGDDAPKWQLARWMAREAVKAGLPPELPVMASLQESSLTNDPTPDEYGSIGYFQLIPSWGAEQRTPEAQLHWFIRQAVALKEKRLAQGVGDFGKNPDKYWEWIADVERPAEQYRHEYAKRLPEAQGLLEEAGRKDGVPKEKLFAAAAAAADQAVAGPSGKARTAVAAAMGQIGVDYAWGGGGPGGPGRGFDQGAAYVGFDCSSLMQYAMAKAGISLQRVAQDQFDMPSADHVDVKHLQPGDLLFFGGQHSVHHVGMYIGNGRFIHAPHTGDKVKISQFAGYYLAEFAGARRYT